MHEAGWGSKEQREEQAYSWLDQVIRGFETAKASGKQFNILATEAAGDAVRVLGFADLDRRIDILLDGLVVGDTLQGAITNIEWSDRMLQPRTRLTREDAASKLPMFSIQAVREASAKFGSHLLACLDRNYHLAFSNASSDQDRAEVVATQAVFGDIPDIETAERLLSTLTRDGQTSAAIVVVIEFYRRGQKTEAEAIHPFTSQSEWTLIVLASGITGRVWPLYPYD